MQNTPRTQKYKQRDTIRFVVFMALFSALAYAVTLLFSIKVSFLTFDAKDAVITVASFLFGPLAGVVISLLVATLELLIGSTTGFYGFIMNFLSSASFSVIASLIYRRKKTLTGALVALLCAVVSLCAVMMLANLLITPFYMGVDMGSVASMIPTLLLPFNFAKALVNAAFAMILYKPVAVTLRRSGFMPRTSAKKSSAESQMARDDDQAKIGAKPNDGTRFVFNRGTVIIVVTAVLALVISGLILWALGAFIA